MERALGGESSRRSTGQGALGRGLAPTLTSPGRSMNEGGLGLGGGGLMSFPALKVDKPGEVAPPPAGGSSLRSHRLSGAML